MADRHPEPRYLTFDCYGTLINFEITKTTKALLADRLTPENESRFIKDFSTIRVDETLGPWKPYPNVIRDSLARAMSKHGLEYRPSDADALVEAVPTWGPYPEVPATLAKLAEAYPLVILSNADPAQLAHNVEKLGAPFHRVLTSTAAHAYKPRHAAFEYMFDALGCGPGDVMHVSSSIRYDIQPAEELHIDNKVWVNRDPSRDPDYTRNVSSGRESWSYYEVGDLSGLLTVLGL